ncbi:restriction endonuclease subunit S [Brachyspira sp.]|uniref:restriction endonuclease subunit S n=1 Tax=Brachyspira sp. TaxID=1977261 RepID=UPI00262FC966|nr:restriction endonuclease subunit S [Brachyspira sp.]
MKNTHLPTGWQEFKLKDIGEILGGGTPSTKNEKYWNGDILWLTPTEVTALKTKYLYDTERKITELGLKNSSAKIIKPNSLIICTRATIGDCCINKKEISTNQGFKSIIPNINHNVLFLYYLINHNRNHLISNSSGSTFLEISKSNLENLSFYFPPLEEQKRIAEILSLCDEVIENLMNLIEKKELYKKGVMQRLLSGEVRFNGFNDEWQTVRLGDILSSGSKNRVNDTSKYKKITIKLHNKGIEFANIERKMADKRPFYIRKKDEIILGKQNYFNGSIAIVSEEFDNTICSNAIMSFTVNKCCNNKFLYFSLSRESYMKRYYHLANGTGQKELSENDFLNFTLLIPSLEEQKKIAELISVIDEEIENLKKQLELRKQQKKGLMQRLLTGEVRI